MIKKYDMLCQKLNLGKLNSIDKFDSSQNNVYKFTTDKGIYVVKEYTKDAINNYYYLKKRKEQIRISKILADNGINCSYPISINKKYFINFKNHYYLVYNHYEEKPLTSNEVSIDHIKILAELISNPTSFFVSVILSNTPENIFIAIDESYINSW